MVSLGKESCTPLHLEELGAAHVEEEVRKVGEAGRPLEALRDVFAELPKLGCCSDQYSIKPP